MNNRTFLSKKANTIYINVMEELVAEEVERQLKLCPDSLRQYIKPVEVETYALNRLAPLYASSEKGKNQQKILGRKQHREKIITAVRQAIAAVQRDPLRCSIPLISNTELRYQEAEFALQKLEELMEERGLYLYQKLSWHNLVSEMQKVLNRFDWTKNSVNNGEIIYSEH
jgi:Late competence development protein ComFB